MEGEPQGLTGSGGADPWPSRLLSLPPHRTVCPAQGPRGSNRAEVSRGEGLRVTGQSCLWPHPKPTAMAVTSVTQGVLITGRLTGQAERLLRAHVHSRMSHPSLQVTPLYSGSRVISVSERFFLSQERDKVGTWCCPLRIRCCSSQKSGPLKGRDPAPRVQKHSQAPRVQVSGRHRGVD